MFTPIRTERLLIRPLAADDAASLSARRSQPEVARYQNYEPPYPLERAEKLVASVLALDGPTDEEWWMAAIADADGGETFGDIAIHLSWQGRSAEVGYTLAEEHWRKGYATEALAAIVDYLFDDLGVTRVWAMLHPDNLASAMVLERTGFLFEGHTRSSYWVGDVVSDDWIYGMTKDDRDKWRDRPRHHPDHVELVEVNPENQREVSRLATHKSQERFVAPMSRSFADALFPEVVDDAPLVPWMRAVLADGQYAGFVMLALPTDHHPEPYLWRLLIDRRHQRRGIGRRVLDLIAADRRSRGDGSLLTSWVEGRGSPRDFYLRYGFVPTGNVVDGEIESRLEL